MGKRSLFFLLCFCLLFEERNINTVVKKGTRFSLVCN